MLDRIHLRFGSSPGQPPADIGVGPITVFVGPNNSGKSLVLREIDSLLQNPEFRPAIIENLTVRDPHPDSIARIIVARGAVTRPSDGQPERASIARLRPDVRGPAPGEGYSFVKEGGDWKLQEGRSDQARRLRLASMFTVLIDGRTRLTLLDNAEAGPLTQPPQHHIAALFRDDVTRAKLAGLTNDAFGYHLTIDATPMREFHVKLSRRAPTDIQEERGLDDRAVAFHQAAQHISGFSDGVKAYAGLLAAVLATDYRIILIDEPDAFLHPPMAHRLGRNLGEIAATRDAAVVAATHDADFLMGAVQSGVGVTVVRLTYRADIATARLLDQAQLSVLMRDPLLRSTGVLRALFHVGAVVCEADADRAFYQECNERLLVSRTGGATDTVFLNAQNKQTVRRITRPLRAMGIPAAAVVDIDILKGDDLLDLLDAAFVPEADLATFEADLRAVQATFTTLGVQLDATGLAAAGGAHQGLLDALLKKLSRFGLFLVPCGELEGWLPDLGEKLPKRLWLPAVFRAMGEDPAQDAYTRPTEGDVWDFLRRVGEWIEDSGRLGMPA